MYACTGSAFVPLRSCCFRYLLSTLSPMTDSQSAACVCVGHSSPSPFVPTRNSFTTRIRSRSGIVLPSALVLLSICKGSPRFDTWLRWSLCRFGHFAPFIAPRFGVAFQVSHAHTVYYCAYICAPCTRSKVRGFCGFTLPRWWSLARLLALLLNNCDMLQLCPRWL